MADVLAFKKAEQEKHKSMNTCSLCSVLAAIKSYESIFKARNNILFHHCTVRIQITASTFELLETLECEAHTNVSKSAAGGVGAKAFQV